jgi:hypothetical protein
MVPETKYSMEKHMSAARYKELARQASRELHQAAVRPVDPVECLAARTGRMAA